MPVCTICTHPDVAEIDRLLLSGDEGGTRPLAERFGVSRAALVRHRKNHMARSLAVASGAVVSRIEADPADLVEQVAQLERRARNLLDRADASDDLKTALKAVDSLRQLHELLAKMAGELAGTGLSRAEVRRFGQRMAEVVRAELRGEPERMDRIVEGWRRIHV